MSDKKVHPVDNLYDTLAMVRVLGSLLDQSQRLEDFTGQDLAVFFAVIGDKTRDAIDGVELAARQKAKP